MFSSGRGEHAASGVTVEVGDSSVQIQEFLCAIPLLESLLLSWAEQLSS
jgi:hypothetical protein